MDKEEKDSLPQANPPEQENSPSNFFMRYKQQIWGFVGWYVIADVLSGESVFGVITTVATPMFLVFFAVSKKSKGVAWGILIAVGLNFVAALVRG